MSVDAPTVTVQVRYFNVLADYAGTKRASVELRAGSSIHELLDRLLELNPEAFRRAVTATSGFTSFIRIFRNDELLGEQDFAQPVSAGDEYLIFPAVGGGGRA